MTDYNTECQEAWKRIKEALNLDFEPDEIIYAKFGGYGNDK